MICKMGAVTEGLPTVTALMGRPQGVKTPPMLVKSAEAKVFPVRVLGRPL